MLRYYKLKQNSDKNVLQINSILRFFFGSERGIFPQTEFVFDLELPISFTPKNNDGEVDEFALTKATDVSV